MQVWLVWKLGGGCRIVAHNTFYVQHIFPIPTSHSHTLRTVIYLCQRWIGMFCTDTCSICCCCLCGVVIAVVVVLITSSYMRDWQSYMKVFASALVFTFHSFSQRRRCCRCRRFIWLNFPCSRSVGDFQSIELDGFSAKVFCSLFDNKRFASVRIRCLISTATVRGTCCILCVVCVRLSNYKPSNLHALFISRNALSEILIGHFIGDNSKVWFLRNQILVFVFVLRSNTFHKCVFYVLGSQYNCSVAWMFVFATICLWIWKAADGFSCILLILIGSIWKVFHENWVGLCNLLNKWCWLHVEKINKCKSGNWEWEKTNRVLLR